MKIKTLLAILFGGILIFAGCSKEGKSGGNKIISGTVYYYDGVSGTDNIAPGATVYITYDSKTATGSVDETTTSDATGAYAIKGLKKGDYFLSAEYTSPIGYKYTTPGHGLTIASDKDRVNLNFRLYP